MGFAGIVVTGLRTNPFARIVVPCGKKIASAVSEIAEAANDCGLGVAEVNLSLVETREDFFREVSIAIGLASASTGIEELADAIHNLFQPRVLCLINTCTTSDVTAILESARLIAEVTRDLLQSVRVVWLHESTDICLAPKLPYDVWPPEWRDIPLLSFSDGLGTILYRAFRHFIDQRIYWEAAGQADHIAEVSDIVGSRSSLSPTSRNVDQTINQLFDSIPIVPENKKSALNRLTLASDQKFWIQAIKHEILPRADQRAILQWYATGLVWRPPGMNRWRLTAGCVRTLLDSSENQLTSLVGKDWLKIRLLIARANPHISQMVLLLTTQIESELMDALRQRTQWERLIDRVAIRDELERQQQRTNSGQASLGASDRSLLDYATFGQLVRLAQAEGQGFLFPLSRELLWEVVDIRNSAAHGKPIGWEGVRRSVEAVFSLVT